MPVKIVILMCTYEHRPTAMDNYIRCNTESAYDVINIIGSLS
jgi:hypothetical protein